jgi:GT2 family glycosyltransferase
MKNNISIVILTWNGLEFTKRCLDSLFKSHLPKNCKIIVVDNGSTDGTVEYLKGLPKVKLIQNAENLGYSKAVNIGIKSSLEGSDIVLLNNDVELIEKDWLVKLANCVRYHEEYGVIGVKILQENLTLQHCGAYLPSDTLWGQQLGGGEVDVNQYSGLVECESVVFACAYIPCRTIEKVGLLSEDFFAYFEDTDYCTRAHYAGFKIGMLGDVRVLHSENTSTKINKVSHNQIFNESMETFKKKWSSKLIKDRYQHKLDWHSIINFPTGYAGSSRALVEAMDKSSTSVRYQYVYGPGTVFPVQEPEMSDSYIVNMVRARLFEMADIQVVYAQGDVFERNTGKYKIGYTMLEVDGLPKEWVRQCNLMDEVWVPSQFNVETFQSSGVTVPIHIIPLGIDPNYLNPQIKGNKDPKFYTFLSVFEWGERKAPEILIKAFSDEFSQDEPVRLVCKTNNFDPGVCVKDQIGRLGLPGNGGKIVIAENRILKNYELGVLYKSADCFVLPARGEGWGMPILEAMACGLPVIATNWSAQQDFMNKNNSYLLDVQRMIPANAKCPYYEGFSWADPSYEHLRHLLRWVYENQEEANAVGVRAAKDAYASWTWSDSARKIEERISKI